MGNGEEAVKVAPKEILASEVRRLEGLLEIARTGLKRANEYQAASINGQAIKAAVRLALNSIGWDETPPDDEAPRNSHVARALASGMDVGLAEVDAMLVDAMGEIVAARERIRKTFARPVSGESADLDSEMMHEPPVLPNDAAIPSPLSVPDYAALQGFVGGQVAETLKSLRNATQSAGIDNYARNVTATKSAALDNFARNVTEYALETIYGPDFWSWWRKVTS